MAGKILNEDMIRLGEVPDEIINLFPFWKKKPHRHTVWRWYWKGAYGHQLEGVRLGQEIYTSRQAVKRFIEAGMIDGAPQREVVAKRRRVSTAKRKLRRAGA